MPYQANDQETCLFCLGEAEPTQKLKTNSLCKCKYSYHDACYARYDRKEICPLCKINYTTQKVSNIRPTAPAQHVSITVSFPREATAPAIIAAPYTQLNSENPQSIARVPRKLTPGAIICMAVIVGTIIAVIVGIILATY
jgi:hypothetical protein